MRIAVCIKGGSASPADRAALEVGMGIRERLAGVQLEAFSVCDEAHVDALCFARARGADAVQRIVPPRRWQGHCATALALATRLRVGGAGRSRRRDPHCTSGFDLVLCGERSREPEARIGRLLAELLDLRVATGVCDVRERRRDGVVVERRIAGGGPVPVRVVLPALLAATEDAASTFRVSPERMERARRQPIGEWELEWTDGLPSAAHRGEEREPDDSRVSN